MSYSKKKYLIRNITHFKQIKKKHRLQYNHSSYVTRREVEMNEFNSVKKEN